MAAELSIEELTEVQEALGLPHPALVEKDYYVIRALNALAKFICGPNRLVFGGGTALCRAHRLIGRMSEDIDLKIVSDVALSRTQRRAFREDVRNALSSAGFAVEVRSHDEHRTHVFELRYESVAPAIGSLRPELKVELSSWPTYKPAVECSIGSFVAQAHKKDPEILTFPCAAVIETAAEKFVALTRRIGEERATGEDRDATLLRHVYDLHRIAEADDITEIAHLIRTIIPSDQESRGRSYKAYAEDANREIRLALDALRDDAAYAKAFDGFQRDMVYGGHAEYQECLRTLERIWSLVVDAPKSAETR